MLVRTFCVVCIILSLSILFQLPEDADSYLPLVVPDEGSITEVDGVRRREVHGHQAYIPPNTDIKEFESRDFEHEPIGRVTSTV